MADGASAGSPVSAGRPSAPYMAPQPAGGHIASGTGFRRLTVSRFKVMPQGILQFYAADLAVTGACTGSRRSRRMLSRRRNQCAAPAAGLIGTGCIFMACCPLHHGTAKAARCVFCTGSCASRLMRHGNPGLKGTAAAGQGQIFAAGIDYGNIFRGYEHNYPPRI